MALIFFNNKQAKKNHKGHPAIVCRTIKHALDRIHCSHHMGMMYYMHSYNPFPLREGEDTGGCAHLCYCNWARSRFSHAEAAHINWATKLVNSDIAVFLQNYRSRNQRDVNI